MKYLKEYIRQIIFESNQGPEDLAMTYRFHSNWAEAVIYDKTRLLDVLDDILDSHGADDKVLSTLAQRLVDEEVTKGFVDIGEPPGDDGRCNDAWEVSIAAGPRYGHVLYQVAFGLAAHNGKSLTSDRGGSSSAAQTRWGKEVPGRNKTPFDDLKDPKTPPPEDDCKLQTNPILNFSYGALPDDEATWARLRDNHLKTYRELESRFSALGSERVAAIKEHLRTVLLKSSGKFWNKHRPR